MRIEHDGKRPTIDDSAWVAPTAVVSGDVAVAAGTRVLHGAVLTAETGPIMIGEDCVIMEQAVLRGTRRQPLVVGDRVLVGPHAHLSGCTIANEAFLATGTRVFNGAHVGHDAEIRVNATVHLKTRIKAHAVVPIGWVAVGDPAQLFPPDRHEDIWAVQEPLDFPGVVFGLSRAEHAGPLLAQAAPRYSRALATHASDRPVD